ncbi:MAG: asparagine synthase-related protein, partial [Acidobacteriota bacterium]
MTGRPDTQVGRLGVFRADEGCEVAALAGGEAGGAVVFNGYLFDRSELIADLGLPGAETTCAEIAAAAYARWGSEVFDRLDGCYLLAIWDAAAEVLLLGHDALGRHPVFYALEAGRLWFGANVLSVAHAEGVRREPNRLSLALQFLLHWPDAGETFFEHVRRVRPGHFVRVSSDLSWSEHKYWEPMPADDEPFMSADDVHEQFEPALTRAVDRCLALGAQGIMLSGGVDSVTVAALAARQLRDRGASPLVAVSARTGGPLIDEEIMQSRVCEALGMPHIVSTTPEWKDGRDDVSLSLDIMADLPAPTHIWWVGTYTRFYQRTAAQELNVLMTGAGGDNWLGVADSHAADLMRGGRVGELYRFIKSDIVTGGASVKG